MGLDTGTAVLEYCFEKGDELGECPQGIRVGLQHLFDAGACERLGATALHIRQREVNLVGFIGDAVGEDKELNALDPGFKF